jgi:IS5 family transposase
MHQKTFAELEYDRKKRKTRREKFLERMEKLIPWDRLEQRIAPVYPKGGKGRQPYPLSVMLRIHCVQLFYNLSDPAMEDLLYEVESVRRFTGISLDKVPDETTILNFRRRLEKSELGRGLFDEINGHLASQGLSLKEGTIVDASLIAAAPSTKNAKGERDPEMHQSKKGKQWYFGMKMHIGVDDVLGLVHSFEATPGNVHDLDPTNRLLHGGEKRVWTDAGYRGMQKRPEHRERSVEWSIARPPGTRRELSEDTPESGIERIKASVRAKVEHPFRYVKRVFGYEKVRHRGLARNENRLALLLGFANLMRAERYLEGA